MAGGGGGGGSRQARGAARARGLLSDRERGGGTPIPTPHLQLGAQAAAQPQLEAWWEIKSQQGGPHSAAEAGLVTHSTEAPRPGWH